MLLQSLQVLREKIPAYVKWTSRSESVKTDAGMTPERFSRPNGSDS